MLSKISLKELPDQRLGCFLNCWHLMLKIGRFLKIFSGYCILEKTRKGKFQFRIPFRSFSLKSQVVMAKRAKLDYQAIRDDLKCFKCSMMPRPESTLRFCPNRHTICGKCYGESLRCCDSEAVPCYLVDKILLDLPFECAATKFGCKKTFMKEDLLRHEKICGFRKITCPFVTCKAGVSFLNFMNHINQEHWPYLRMWNDEKTPNGFIFQYDTDMRHLITTGWKPAKLTAFDRVFFEVGAVLQPHFGPNAYPLMYRWVYILASPDEAKNYIYHATLKGESEKEMSFCGQVKSLNESMEEVIKKQTDLFVIGLKVAMNMNVSTYQIKLRCLKAEAKDDSEESGISD